jgi:hypothetical protein
MSSSVLVLVNLFTFDGFKCGTSSYNMLLLAESFPVSLFKNSVLEPASTNIRSCYIKAELLMFRHSPLAAHWAVHGFIC